MKLFSCGVCGSTVHFDSVRCEACGTGLGLAPDICDIAMIRDASGMAEDRHGGRWRLCAHNTPDAGCNLAGGEGWMTTFVVPLVPAEPRSSPISPIRIHRGCGSGLEAEKTPSSSIRLAINLPITLAIA